MLTVIGLAGLSSTGKVRQLCFANPGCEKVMRPVVELG